MTSIFIQELCIFVYKHQHKYKLISEVHNFNTRTNHKFYQIPCRTNVMLNSPQCLGLRMFNCLPTEFKISKNINVFRNKLKHFLLEKVYYNINEFFMENV